MPSAAKKKPKRTAYSLDTLTVRITRGLHTHITSKGVFGESIDAILRRLLKLPKWKPPGGGEGDAGHEVPA